jgi:hypothetical protein
MSSVEHHLLNDIPSQAFDGDLEDWANPGAKSLGEKSTEEEQSTVSFDISFSQILSLVRVVFKLGTLGYSPKESVP